MTDCVEKFMGQQRAAYDDEQDMRAFQIVIDRRPVRTVPTPLSSLRGIVDVLVDGTNVTARIGQDHALPLLRDLAYAAAALADGRHARATVRFYDQRDAWAMGLERVGAQVLITVYQGGAGPKVAVHERPVPGDALVRGVQQAIEDVLSTPTTPGALAGDLEAARRYLDSVSWRSELAAPEQVEARIEGHPDAPLSFGTRIVVRVRPDAPPTSEVESNDLHSLLFLAPFRLRVGDVRREIGEIHVFVFAETLLRQAADVLAAWQDGRAMHHRSETAGVFLTTRLATNGKLALSIGGPRTGGLRGAPTFPSVAVPGFVEAVVSFARALSRPIVRHDRWQLHNLRMRTFREAARELAESLREAVNDDAKYNDAPESYKAFAASLPGRATSTQEFGHSRIRFSECWQATVPGIDLHSTFLIGDRLVVAGARELACIDRAVGHLIWRAPIDRGVSIPAPAGIVRISPEGHLSHYELDTGEITALAKLNARSGGMMPAGAVVSSPGLPRLVVVSEGERHVTAVDLLSGEVRWRHTLGRGRSFKVRRAGRLLVVSTSEHALTALDVASGETVWRIRDRLKFCRPVAYDANDLFVVSGDAAPIARNCEVLHALDPWTGVSRWRRELAPGRRAVGAPLSGPQVVVVVTHDQRGTGFTAIDRADGTPRWTIEPGYAPSTSAWLTLDDLLIVNGDNGVFGAIDLRDGSTRWQQVADRGDDGDAPRSLDPILRSGALFIPQHTITVVRPHDGYTLGTVPGDLVPDLVRVDERCNVVVVEESGHLVAFSAGARLTLVKA
ncbi:MAG: PQQ-like beta-propeller repeat protein [Polyangiaceae bacterium]|jgi:outer membrane protein assembly factor BamB|nr:PQQ-like beta-propeller repeat protein [Polyangiaceae bacterium]